MKSVEPLETIAGSRVELLEGRVTATELTENSLARIDGSQRVLNTFLTIDRDGALAIAEKIDEKARKGDPLGPLAGTTVAVKDNILTKDVRTTAASKILENYRPVYDAHVIEKLRAADAILVGKTNLDEFAMGSSTENSAFGPSRNPWDINRVPGGSSGGSAAAVSSAQTCVALGTDTGGSIRQPASLCGIVGLKPTWGRVSRYGVIAFASSLDQVGPMGRNVDDVARLLRVIAGHDSRDSTAIDVDVPDYSHASVAGIQGLRVGVPKEYFSEGIDPEVESAVRTAIDELAAAGADIVEVSLPHTQYCLATYYLIAPAEASSNLARYDGVRYGLRCESDELEDMYERTRAAGFGAEVKRRIMLGTYALSAGYYDAFYGTAQRVRTLIRQDMTDVFQSCDVLATPTSPITACSIGERITDPLQMYLMDIYTISANLAGIPAISQTCGFSSNGLPIGLQLMGRSMDEMTLLSAAHAYESRTEWHLRQPPQSVGGS
jgi:aspartyl-tRNA(Asn)/glutamyl-tRNA(Gln) amidotransferase subunit A